MDSLGYSDEYQVDPWNGELVQSIEAARARMTANSQAAIHIRDLALLSFLDFQQSASEYGEPASLLDAATALSPEDADICFWRGYVSEIRDHDFAFATSQYEKALELSPDHLYALQVSATDGGLEERVERLQRCLELQPNDIGVLEWLANVYIESGDVASAQSTLRETLEVDPFKETKYGYMNEYINDVFTQYNRADKVRAEARDRLDKLRNPTKTTSFWSRLRGRTGLGG